MTSRREFITAAGGPVGAAALGAFSFAADRPGSAIDPARPAPEGWASVRDFGASGEGETNDAPAIQAAIDSLEGRRGIIYFPPGRYRCEAGLNARRAHLMGAGVPGVQGGGGTTIAFPGTDGIHSSTEDNFGYEISFIRIVGSVRKERNGQILVDFTGQNYPRMRESRVFGAEIGVRLANGRSVECHYGAFFNVHTDRCHTGIDLPGSAHSHKFFAGRFWDCRYAVRNVDANDIAFFGSEFESDVPLWHPPREDRENPITLLVGTRQESAHAPIIESGSYSDLGSYWSGYRRPTAFGVRDGEVSYRGRIMTAGIAGDSHPVDQNFLRNPGLVPGPDGDTLPGWTVSGGAPEIVMGPFGRIVKFTSVPSSAHYVEQSGIRLPAGRYTVGYGFQTEGTAETRLYVFDGDRTILESTGIPGGYAGGLVTRGFTLDRDSDEVTVRLYRSGTAGTTLYYYAPFLVPAPGGGPFLPVPEASRPTEVRYGTQPPRTGRWRRGDVVRNTAPSPGGHVGWVCVAEGRPGTWKEFGEIAM